MLRPRTDSSPVLEDLEEAGVVLVQHEATDLSLEDFPDVDVDLSDLEDEGASA